MQLIGWSQNMSTAIFRCTSASAGTRAIITASSPARSTHHSCPPLPTAKQHISAAATAATAAAAAAFSTPQSVPATAAAATVPASEGRYDGVRWRGPVGWDD